MLSHRIAYLRKKAGLTQAQLAKTLNISPSTAGMYEQGRRLPAVDTLAMMAQIFDVSLDFLVTGAEHRYSDTDKPNHILDDCPCNTCFWKHYIESNLP